MVNDIAELGQTFTLPGKHFRWCYPGFEQDDLVYKTKLTLNKLSPVAYNTVMKQLCWGCGVDLTYIDPNHPLGVAVSIKPVKEAYDYGFLHVLGPLCRKCGIFLSIPDLEEATGLKI